MRVERSESGKVRRRAGSSFPPGRSTPRRDQTGHLERDRHGLDTFDPSSLQYGTDPSVDINFDLPRDRLKAAAVLHCVREVSHFGRHLVGTAVNIEREQILRRMELSESPKPSGYLLHLNRKNRCRTFPTQCSSLLGPNSRRQSMPWVCHPSTDVDEPPPGLPPSCCFP